jgi:hypothetical protein
VRHTTEAISPRDRLQDLLHEAQSTQPLELAHLAIVHEAQSTQPLELAHRAIVIVIWLYLMALPMIVIKSDLENKFIYHTLVL